MILHMEMRVKDAWHPIGSMKPGDREGSVSNNTDGDREVIRFRLEGDHAVIERSRAGIDYERGEERGILSVGYEELARLSAGETYERQLQTDRMVEALPIRWRLA